MPTNFRSTRPQQADYDSDQRALSAKDTEQDASIAALKAQLLQLSATLTQEQTAMKAQIAALMKASKSV